MKNMMSNIVNFNKYQVNCKTNYLSGFSEQQETISDTKGSNYLTAGIVLKSHGCILHQIRNHDLLLVARAGRINITRVRWHSLC